MAEFLARHHLGVESEWDVRSAGTSAAHGMPASREGVVVMDELGIDTRSHSSQPLTSALIDQANMIVCMARSHQNAIVSQFPEASDRVFLLNSFASSGEPGDVEDPIGMPVDVYRSTRNEIDAAIRRLLPQLPDYTVD